MKKLYKLTILCVFLSYVIYGQETYTALKVCSETAPIIDGKLDAIWSVADLVALTKDVDDGDRTTEKDPDESDYKAEFSVFWSDTGLYILVLINDDVFVNDNGAYWYKDDDVNILIPSDLISTGLSPLEFAWLVMSVEEGKAIPYQNVPKEAVVAAWSNSGSSYIMEVYISWNAFSATGKEGSNIMFEVRARDDDNDGASIYPQSFLQWSTDQKSVENDGNGLGTVLLSANNATLTSIDSKNRNSSMISIFPNPCNSLLFIKRAYTKEENLIILNYLGHIVYEQVLFSKEETIDLLTLPTGLYFVEINDYQKLLRIK